MMSGEFISINAWPFRKNISCLLNDIFSTAEQHLEEDCRAFCRGKMTAAKRSGELDPSFYDWSSWDSNDEEDLSTSRCAAVLTHPHASSARATMA